MGINGHRSELPITAHQTQTTLLILEWGFLLVAITLWVITDSLHPWMSLGVGLLVGSVLARWVRLGRFSRSTPLDFPLVLFLISAAIALWAAPNTEPAIHRIYLILGAVAVYYSTVNSRSRVLGILSIAVVILVTAGSIYFASQHDWSASPARFTITGRIGLFITQIVPDLGLPQPHWNVIRNIMASLIGLAFPIATVSFGRRLQQGDPPQKPERTGRGDRQLERWIFGLGGLGLFLGLLLTESRTPWLVGVMLAGLSIWWWFAGRFPKQARLGQTRIFWGGLGASLGVFLIILALRPGLVNTLAVLPGPNTLAGRQEIFPQSWLLAQDTPFTGGGLAAFPALYSTYIKVTPYNVVRDEDNGNNAYLNVLVEQGWSGLAGLLLILGIPLWSGTFRLKRVHPRYRRFVLAGVFAAGFVVLHGAAHATLVSTRAIPAMLLPAGLALAGPNTEKRGGTRQAPTPILILGGMLLLIVLGASVVSLRGWRASWLSNFGALQMGRLDLAGFPAGEWKSGGYADEYLVPARIFQDAVALDPQNTTAHYRLGLIEMLDRDYDAAIPHLQNALGGHPNHRGIQKNLGYSYAWVGRTSEALLFLEDFPESHQELESYQSWWLDQGRADLAAQAAEMQLSLVK